MVKDADEERPAAGETRDAFEPELSHLLRASEAAPSDLDTLYRRLEQEVAAERGVRAWLRARSSALRATLAWAVVAAFAGASALAFGRPDLDVYPTVRMAAVLLVIGAGVGVSIFLALRPLQRPTVPVRVVAAATSAALLGVLVMYALPAAHTAHPASLQLPGWAALLQRAIPCLAIGLAIGALIYGVLALLDRGGTSRAPAMAVAAGLGANLALQLHCPVTAPLHMVVAHLGVALLLVAAALLPGGRSGR